jgi:hypothetical protein
MASQAPVSSMKTERWKRVEELYHAASERGPDERDGFLEAACAEDGALLREVRSLLGYGEQADLFIDDPTADDREDRLAGGPLSMEEALGALRQIARDWRRRCG